MNRDTGDAALAGRTILAVFAHPDDESLACGGTLARLSDAGAKVVLLCASRGERGSSHGPEFNDQLGKVRAVEMREAARALGIADLLLLDYPDGELMWTRVSGFYADIVMAIRRYAPVAVVTFGRDGLYWHPDHIAVHERTTAAVRSFGAEAPALYYVAMRPGVLRSVVDAAVARGWVAPSQGFWSISPEAFGFEAEPPTCVVDVKEWTVRKLFAIRCHRSQMGADDPFDQVDDEDARGWFGIEHFQRAPTDVSGEPILEHLGI